MKNEILRLSGTDGYTMEVYCVETNETQPYRETREGGIVLLGGEDDIFFDLDPEDLEGMISYLQRLQKHITEFNNNSKPIMIIEPIP